MKKRFQKLIALILGIILLAGCASSYNSIKTSTHIYNNRQIVGEKLDVGYKYDIYSSSLNKKYRKKEEQFNYKTVSVNIKNISGIPIILTKDNFKVYVGENEIPIENTDYYLMHVKQSAGAHILHGLWGPWSITTWSSSTGESGGNVSYYPVGLAIGIINMLVASSANKKHAQEIKELDIFNLPIEPNEEIYGVICLKYNSYDVLRFEYLE